MTLQIFGLYRSGTNYLAWLVAANLDVSVRHGERGDYWKHGPPKEVPGVDGYLLITKDPLAWLASRQRYRPAPVDELCKEYVERGWEFVHFAQRQDAIIIRYEDLLADLDGQVERIALAFGAEWYDGDVIDQGRVMRRGGDAWLKTTDKMFDRSYYTERRYLDDVPASYSFDGELLERLGYA